MSLSKNIFYTLNGLIFLVQHALEFYELTYVKHLQYSSGRVKSERKKVFGGLNLHVSDDSPTLSTGRAEVASPVNTRFAPGRMRASPCRAFPAARRYGGKRLRPNSRGRPTWWSGIFTPRKANPSPHGPTAPCNCK